MTPLPWLPVASALVIGIFVAVVVRRYQQRGGAHLLMWGAGLTMFGIANLAEAYSARTWHPVVFRLWYLCGAVYTAAWLGQGTVLLLSRRKRFALTSMAVLAVASVLAAVVAFVTPLNAGAFDNRTPLSAQFQRILPEGAAVRKLTPAFNIYGTLTLVGGALYSAWLLWRKAMAPTRVIGNVLIAVGALSLALASTLVRFGRIDVLYLAEFLAAVTMFAGFLLATLRVGQLSAAPGRGRA